MTAIYIFVHATGKVNRHVVHQDALVTYLEMLSHLEDWTVVGWTSVD